MKSNRLRAAMLAVAGIAVAGCGLEAQAAEILVVNTSSHLIHPYFRSNCWDPAQFPGMDAKTWVNFGSIDVHAQYGWTGFEGMLKANCKKPKMHFTFALDGETPPVVGSVKKDRKVNLDFDATVPVYTITLGDPAPVITDVTPDEEDDSDD